MTDLNKKVDDQVWNQVWGQVYDQIPKNNTLQYYNERFK
jgi:hypothetical protein